MSNSLTWVLTFGRVPDLPPGALILALGRMDDVFGPMPFEMITEEAWFGNSLHYRHDLKAYMVLGRCDSGSDAERGDAFAAPSEGSQSGGEAASPNPCSLIEKDSRRGG